MRAQGDDIVLVLAAQGGDRAALAALLARHWPLLAALCHRVTADAALAEEAAQEAALQALLSLNQLRRPAAFGPWLGGIGLNCCRRLLRARGADPWSWEALAGGYRAPEPIDTRPGPEELAAAADLRARVRRAVAGLPTGQRAAVLLFYLRGLTHAETAALLGIEVGAVKGRLHKARRHLRRALWTLWEEDTMAETTETTTADLIDVRVADVRRTTDEAQHPHYLVLLEEVGGERRLPIWIGRFEGEALALAIEGVETPRPMAFAFAASLLRAAGGRLREARISRLVGDVFYAVAVVDGPAGPVSIDARPSDALNLALLAGAPIRAAASLLAGGDVLFRAGEVATPASAATAPEGAEPITRPFEGHGAFLGEGSRGAAEIAAEIVARWPGAGRQP